jgi:ankyrin repeat protein
MSRELANFVVWCKLANNATVFITLVKKKKSITMSTLFCASPAALAEAPPKDYAVNRGESIGGVSRERSFQDGIDASRSSGAPGGGGGAVHSSAINDEPEVDYDEGGTELYKKIEGKDWDGAMARLETHPLEAKTWISRRESADTHKIRWRLLPIHATCIFRSPLALMEALIKANRDGPQMKDDQGMLPVHLACRNGASKGVVLTLLNAFPESIAVKDRKGRIPLSFVEASTSQNKEAVIVAMKRFQQGHKISRSVSLIPTDNINEVDYEHRTVLFRMILKKDWSGAIARANSFPDEAATWIVTKGFNGNLRFLPLHKACVLQPPESIIEALVAAYIDGTQCKDQDGWLPIHCACFYGASDRAINTLLVAHPKGAQSKDDEGRLPLHYACLKSAPHAVIDVLLSSFTKGAMSKDDEGRLPIHHACSKGASEGVIEALLKASPKGAQSKDDQGRLPLHHACRKAASEKIVRTLLRVYPRAAQVKDDQDKLPIHYACQNGASPSVITILLTTYPESINVRNGFGYSPLAEARAMDNPKMEPIINVLEKFKSQQDKIKSENGENAALEAKVSFMAQRIIALEQAISTVANLGKDLKYNAKKSKDPVALLEKFADKLATIDIGIQSPAIPASPQPANKSPLRQVLGRAGNKSAKSPK